MIWRLLLSVVLLPLVPTRRVEAQVVVDSGTILLYEETNTQIIVVADSRKLVRVNGKSALACKIQNLSDDMLFFYSGNLFEGVDIKTSKVLFSQYETAREAFNSVKNEPRTERRLWDTANKYVELVRPRMEKLFPAMSRADASETIGLAGFAGLDEFNHPRMLQVRNEIVVPNDGTSPVYLGSPSATEPPLDSLMMSDPCCPPYREVSEFFGGKTLRAKQAMAKYKLLAAKLPDSNKKAHLLIAAAEAALNWDKGDPHIGPPIDAVVVESTGIRWVRRKPMCEGRRTKE